MFGLRKTRNKEISKKQATSAKFNINPQKYEYCQNYLSNLTCFFMIESKYKSNYHYVALNKTDGKLYEIHTYVVGFEGAYTHTKEVLDFLFPPRELSIQEFLELVDNRYQGISVLYDGINEKNLYLYKELLESLHTQRKIAAEMSINLENRKYVCVFYRSDLAVKRICQENSEIYNLVAIAEFLLGKGFVFERAFVGGGITEISHTGTVAYNASYLTLDDFRNNFDNDIKLANEETDRKYSGWATIDYRLITTDLHSDSLKIRIEKNDNVNEIIRIEWHNLNKSFDSLIEETNRKLLGILGESVELKEFYSM